VVQDYVDALKQKVVKLEAMAARNSNDKGISAQVRLLCSPLWLQNQRFCYEPCTHPAWHQQQQVHAMLCHGGSVQCFTLT